MPATQSKSTAPTKAQTAKQKRAAEKVQKCMTARTEAIAARETAKATYNKAMEDLTAANKKVKATHEALTKAWAEARPE